MSPPGGTTIKSRHAGKAAIRDRMPMLAECPAILGLTPEALPPHVRQWMGSSVGHWDGDTLVVETTNFTDKTRFRGSGENLKVTESFTLAEDGTILYRFTVEDPSTWERALDGRVQLEPEPRRDLRVRLPRGQLCAGNRASWRSTCRGGGGRERPLARRRSRTLTTAEAPAYDAAIARGCRWRHHRPTLPPPASR